MISRHNEEDVPKQILQNEFDLILQAVTRFPDGGSVEHISDVLEFKLPRRTLQRRLALLVEQKRLTAEGRGRGSRYRRFPADIVIDVPTAKLTLQTHAPQVEIYIPITSEATAIKHAVREPIQNRHPVGYNRAFLDTYRPNETYYLAPEIRQRLLELGRSSEGERPAGTYARQIFSRLLIDLSWNSSRLEGNTYSLLETERLLELGETAEGKNAQEAQMILNHKSAIELLVEQAFEVGFNRYTILNLHALLSDNLLGDPQACGRLRTIPVGITKSAYHPLEVPQLIDECFQQILDTAAGIADPFEQAFFAMVQLPYLQPFEDVNKRVSRLAANVPLIRENLSPLSFVDVPKQAYLDGIQGVYELNRVELLRDVFVWAYERSCARYSAVRRSLGEPDPFRLHYRALVAEIIAAVVRGCMDKKIAGTFIKRIAAEKVTQEDQARFIEVVETEIMSLHEGNIARYRLRPVQYHTWRETWR
ncbi:MAG: Fic family protein [Gammaproteobacteria bacterium]|nr:Fic family protein [Gammaproteobacteria bacterium]